MEPITRIDAYLAYLNGEQTHLPLPVTRLEGYLYRLCRNQGIVGNGGGMSPYAVSLLMEILEAAVYSANVSGKIESLKEALASGGSSGTETPDEPDVPAVTDDITVSDGVVTIVTVGSAITVSDGVMTVA